MSEITKSAFGYEITTDDNEMLEITELSMSSNFKLEVSVEGASEILNKVAGDVDDQLLADAFQFLVEEHAGEEQWFEQESEPVPEEERASFGELMAWADENGVNVR